MEFIRLLVWLLLIGTTCVDGPNISIFITNTLGLPWVVDLVTLVCLLVNLTIRLQSQTRLIFLCFRNLLVCHWLVIVLFYIQKVIRLFGLMAIALLNGELLPSPRKQLPMLLLIITTT